MSKFSPYIYEINSLPLVSIKKIEESFDHFTFLTKPVERNVYKISLRQLMNYLIDFGIGYNSVCVTTLKFDNNQEFASTMYVNRHRSTSLLRPATVVDLKEKLLGAIETLITETVQKRDRMGVTVANTIYPKYIFTLDETLDSLKLKQITGKDYVEEKNFSDFPFTNTNASVSKIIYSNGYVPADMLLMCPSHNHGGGVNDSMKKSIKYEWYAYLKPKGATAWSGHINDIFVKVSGGNKDNHVGKAWNAEYPLQMGACDSPSISPAWQFPTGVSCYPNDPVYPKNTLDDGVNVTIRYPGRRYRLFKQVDA